MCCSYFAFDWCRLLCHDVTTRDAGVLCGGINGTVREAGIVCVGITGMLERVYWCSLCWHHWNTVPSSDTLSL